jgi:hypothetical protein
MAKYRLLSIDEFDELEKEFNDFLGLNTITDDDWATLKKNQPEKADRIIELFSDVVFESIMRKTMFLEWRGKKELKILQCLEDRFVVVGLDASRIHKANLLDSKFLLESVKNPPSELKVFTNEIKYGKPREEEIFKMTEIGYSITNEKLFKTLCLVLPSG